MLPLQHRFRLREHPSFFQHAKRVYSPFFVIFWQKNEEPLFQATVIVSKKVASKATERNKLKRMLRNALFPQVQSNKPVRIVASAHPRIKSASFAEIESELNKCMNQINI